MKPSRVLPILLSAALCLCAQLSARAAPDNPPRRPPPLSWAETRPAVPQLSAEGAVSAGSLAPVTGESRLVFESARDGAWGIYRADDGGPAQRLTSSAHLDVWPRLNLAGTRIAFASNRDGLSWEVYAMNADGSGQVRLTDNFSTDTMPAWSPDSSRIAFVSNREGEYDLYVMNADGSGVRRLTTAAGDDAWPSWSPDGARLIYVAGAGENGRVYTVDVGTGQTAPVDIFGGARYIERPIYAPDGQRFAFNGDIDGDYMYELVVVTPGAGWAVYDAGDPLVDVWAGAWSPDGQVVLYVHADYVEQGGWLYFHNARIEGLRLSDGYRFIVSNGGRDINPSWQVVEDVSPSSEMRPLPPFSGQGRAEVRWQGGDAGALGLGGYDVQARTAGAAGWTDWLTRVTGTTATYYGAPGTTVAFRARARDRGGNTEPWPAGDAAETSTTFYTWRLSGSVTDARGLPVPGARLAIWPEPLPSASAARADRLGQYAARLTSYAPALIAAKPGHGSWPSTVYTVGADARVNFVLPPHDNQVADGNFERDGLGPAWSASGMPPPDVAVGTARSGIRAAALGSIPVYITRTLPYTNARDVASVVDAAEVQHVTWIGADGGLYYARKALRETEWSTRPMTVSASDVAWQQLVADGAGGAHVVWLTGNSLMHCHLPTAGRWDCATIDVSSGAWHARLKLDQFGRLHVMHMNYGGLATSYAWRDASGAWHIDNNNFLMVYQGTPDIAVDDHGVIHMAYVAGAPHGGVDVSYYTRTLPGGWSQPRVLRSRGALMCCHHVRLAFDRDRNLLVFTGSELLTLVGGSPDRIVAEGIPEPLDRMENTLLFTPDGAMHWPLPDAGGNGARIIDRVRLPDGKWVSHAYPNPIPAGDGGWRGVSAFGFGGLGYAYLAAVDSTADARIHGLQVGMAAAVDSVLTRRFQIPPDAQGATLSFLLRRHPLGPGVPSFSVAVSDGPSSTVTHAVSIDPALARSGEWQHAWIDLQPYAGRAVSVSFVLRPEAGQPHQRVLLDEVSLGSWLTPQAMRVTPSRIVAGAPATTVVISGVNFQSTPAVRLDDTLLAGVEWLGSGAVRATLPAGLAIGSHDVWVTNPDGRESTLVGGVRVGPSLYLPLAWAP